MTDTKVLHKILKYDLCLGCGLCSSILGKENCDMKLSENGFYQPNFKNRLEGKGLQNLCPGIKVHGNTTEYTWGNVKEVVEGWAAEANLRHKAASGGIVSSLALFMLESGKADAVLQVGVKKESYLYNELKISRSKDDIIHNAQSRYAPALTLVNIKQILDDSNEKYVFIGKPCDIAGVKNLIEQYPHYKERFVLFISIFCAGIPSYKATEKTWKMSGREDAPKKLKYRGDGWPGEFRATWSDGQEFKMTYHDSWGKILGRHLGFRCKICPDGIGLLADVAVGDSWNTKDGYPDFSEAEGRCFVFIRTDRGLTAMNTAKEGGYMEYHKLDIDKIQFMQAYQYGRRMLVGWRLLPVIIATNGLIDFSGLGIIKQARKANLRSGIMNLTGSFKRMLNIILKG